MIYPPLGEITYADGSTFKLPHIAESQNGWTYKPDSLRTEKEIRQNKNKVWPRAEGQTHANNWYRDEIAAHFAKNKEVPLLVEGGKAVHVALKTLMAPFELLKSSL